MPLPLSLDVTNDKQVAAATRAATEKFGRIDVLVNNAGYGYQASIEEGDEAEIRAQFDANVFGLFAMTRSVLPVMRKQKSGHVINITSVAGFIGFAGSGYYSASKACGRGVVRRSRQGGRAARSARDLRRAGSLPHGLGRSVAEADSQQDRRLCGDGRRPA